MSASANAAMAAAVSALARAGDSVTTVLVELLSDGFAQPPEPTLTSKGPLVVAYHPTSRRIGAAVLAEGGNAFDAFVATAIAENIEAEGASSLAGSMAALVFTAADGNIQYLDAGFSDPLDPLATWSADHADHGRAILVPGAPAGLWTLWQRHGSLGWVRLLAPAIALARDGFPVTPMMARILKLRANVLRASEAGGIWLDGRRPRRIGEMIVQQQAAEFLERFAADGPAHVYAGAWGERFLTMVAKTGGALTKADLAAYAPAWLAPHRGKFAGSEIASSAGTSFGGPWVLRALARLGETTALVDHAGSLATLPSFLASLADIATRTWADPDLLATRPDECPIGIHCPAAGDLAGSAHSYPIITRDTAGNLVCGTISIQSEPWADGIFIDGIPLTAAGRIALSVSPGGRRLSPFCQHLALADSGPVLAITTIANSMAEASYQLLATLLTENCSLEDAVSRPRFGTAPPARGSSGLSADFGRIWIDPRCDREQRRAVRRASKRQPVRTAVDTGLGAVLRITANGAEGQLLPLPYINNPFEYLP